MIDGKSKNSKDDPEQGGKFFETESSKQIKLEKIGKLVDQFVNILKKIKTFLKLSRAFKIHKFSYFIMILKLLKHQLDS